MTTSIFTNISDEDFSSKWDGRNSRVFKPGESMLMESYLAEHYAKHLTNQILTEEGNASMCSPKRPGDVPRYMEIFSQACIPGDNDEEDDTPESTSNKVATAEKKTKKAAAKKEVVEEEEFEGVKKKKVTEK